MSHQHEMPNLSSAIERELSAQCLYGKFRGLQSVRVQGKGESRQASLNLVLQGLSPSQKRAVTGLIKPNKNNINYYYYQHF